ncbi:MAG: NTP transferase domain-containing protein [Salinigranum sp.]
MSEEDAERVDGTPNCGGTPNRGGGPNRGGRAGDGGRAPPTGGDDPPVVEPALEFGSASGDGLSVWGVLLAAGTSSRFGEANKLLTAVDGEPMVRRAARTLLRSSVDAVVVVVGHEADRVRAAVDGLDVRIEANPDYAAGQATSMRTGVAAARAGGADAVVFALGDMPFVDAASIDALVEAFRAGVGDPLAAAYEGRRGNPVLFGAGFFADLLDVEGDTGGRDVLVGSETTALVETGDPGVRRDVDRPGDLGE